MYDYESVYRTLPTFTLAEIQTANAKAVEILIRVRGLDEAEAVRVMRDYLIALGGRSSCPQAEALLRQYPQQADRYSGGCSNIK